jgi:hypothetical protein
VKNGMYRRPTITEYRDCLSLPKGVVDLEGNMFCENIGFMFFVIFMR